MEVTEEDSPAIRQCKCAISKELRSRWSLNSIDPTSPGSDLVAVCLDPRFKQAKFLESHQHLDLQTDLARCEKAATEQKQQQQQQQDLTTEKESDSRPKALDLLLGSDSPASSSDSSDPVQDEVENYFKQEQSPRHSSPLDWWKVNGHRFLLLARLSRKCLAITATSTPAERVFSVAGLIVSRLRASLSPEHLIVSRLRASLSPEHLIVSRLRASLSPEHLIVSRLRASLSPEHLIVSRLRASLSPEHLIVSRLRASLSPEHLIVSRLRASLSPEHVDMLVFLNKNMDLKVDS